MLTHVQADPFGPYPSSQRAGRWKTWCFSFCWPCGGSPGCCLCCCHQRRGWKSTGKLKRDRERSLKKGWSVKGKTFCTVQSQSYVKMDFRPGCLTHLRNSRLSSNIAPGWVCVILSNRSARGVGGGVESRRARDLSSSLLFWGAEWSQLFARLFSVW